MAANKVEDVIPASPDVSFTEPIISVSLDPYESDLVDFQLNVGNPSFTDDDTVDNDIEDLQRQVSQITDRIVSDSDNTGTQNNNNNDSSTDSDSETYYQIEVESEDEEEETVTIAVENYSNDIEHEDDFGDGWTWTNTDEEGPSVCPFFGKSFTNLNVIESNKPEDFFNAFFETNMWTTIAEETNRYARQTIAKNQGRNDIIEATSIGNVKKYSRLNNWKDVNEGDIKVFMAHIIVLGLVKKSNLERYWSNSDLVHTPFFGKYLSRNAFQKLLWTLHLSDNSKSHPRGHRRHDPLFKLRKFMNMLQRNFKYIYKPKKGNQH